MRLDYGTLADTDDPRDDSGFILVWLVSLPNRLRYRGSQGIPLLRHPLWVVSPDSPPPLSQVECTVL